ncbi:MAG: hypothetical protein Q8S31_06125 [Alphaproteobacteria bacterium]|nr:hypothetical protein [Alphaproteobacteria bacterium]
MKRLKIIIISFFLCSSSVFAETYEERKERHFQITQFVLNTIEELFDNSIDDEKKDIVSKKISCNYLRQLKNIKDLEFDKLYELEKRDPEVDATNVLALAICLGDTTSLYKFLNYVDDINDKKYWVWGYRQLYTMAHLILDPQYPIVTHEISLKTRLHIMDMLIQKGLDFDIIPATEIYRNPALAAGDPSGHEICAPFIEENTNLIYRNIADELRVRALLAGANPIVCGSSFSGIPIVSRPYENDKYQHNKPLIVTSQAYGWLKYLQLMNKQIEENLTNPFFKLALHPKLEKVIKE